MEKAEQEHPMEMKEEINKAEPKCVTGCKHYTGGEIKHDKGCPFYPDSLSRRLDELEAQATPQKELAPEMCEDCKGHGWRMMPGTVDDSGVCPSCSGTGEAQKELAPLRELSEITDEDAIEVAKMNRFKGTDRNGQIHVGRDILYRVFNLKTDYMCLAFECADYLRSKGYNIPNNYPAPAPDKVKETKI